MEFVLISRSRTFNKLNFKFITISYHHMNRRCIRFSGALRRSAWCGALNGGGSHGYLYYSTGTAASITFPNDLFRRHMAMPCSILAHGSAKAFGTTAGTASSVEDLLKKMQTALQDAETPKEWLDELALFLYRETNKFSSEVTSGLAEYFGANANTPPFFFTRNDLDRIPFVLIFAYPNENSFMAVVRGKKGPCNWAAKSIDGEKVVKKWEVIKEGQEEGCYLCTLDISPLNEHLAGKESKILDAFFSATQGPPPSVGKAFTRLYDSNKTGIAGLPKYFRLYHDEIEGILRPVPGQFFKLSASFQCKKDPNNPEVSSIDTDAGGYPFVFAGVSGMGKSVAAIMLPQETILDNARCGGVEYDIVGMYYNQGLSNEEPDKDELKAAETLGEIIGKQIAAHCTDRVEKSKDLSNTLFYIVFDEMGKNPIDRKYTRLLIKYRTKVISQIRTTLASEPYAFTSSEACRFVFSVAGTGVTSSGLTGSLPKGYHLWEPKSAMEGVIFRGNLMDGPDSSLSHAFLEAVKQHYKLVALLSIPRCEALLAKGIVRLSLATTKSNFSLSISRDDAFTIVSTNASFLEVNTSLAYVRVTGWDKLKSINEKVFYAKWLLSLFFTQPHGFHLLPPDVVDVLVHDVGAVNDTLVIESEPVKGAAQRPDKHATFGMRGYLPTDTRLEYNTSEEKVTVLEVFSREKGRDIAMRFGVPPALFVVALNLLGMSPGEYTISPKAYEAMIASILSAMLEVFAWQAAIETRGSASSIKVPLRFLLPEVSPHLQNVELDVKVPQALREESYEGVNNKEAWGSFITACSEKREVVEANNLGTTEFEDIVEQTWKQVEERGVAVVTAGDNTPLSDITLFTKHQTIGIELQNYTEDGSVRLGTLQKRCYQMGYLDMQLTTKAAGCARDAHDTQYAEYALPEPLHPLFEHAPRVPASFVLNTRDMTVAKAELVPHADPCVDSPLLHLRFDVSATDTRTSRIGRLFHTLMRGKQLEASPKTEEYLVLCSPKAPLLPTKDEGLVNAQFRLPCKSVDAPDNSLKSWKEDKVVSGAPCLLSCVVMGTTTLSTRCGATDTVLPAKSETPEKAPSVYVYSDRVFNPNQYSSTVHTLKESNLGFTQKPSMAILSRQILW